MSLKAILLAAGKGTRMKSDTLKVMHEVAGKPIIRWVVNAVSDLGVDRAYVVVGHQAESITSHFSENFVDFVIQDKQLGTGHAVMVTESAVAATQDDTVLVLAGDCPLIQPDTLRELLQFHTSQRSVATILTAKIPDAGHYGRILRDSNGQVLGIKEAKDCNQQELTITEFNTGVFAFNGKTLFDSLKKITTDNAQNEYYLTDVIEILKSDGQIIGGYCTEDADQTLGINNRADLATITSIIYQRQNSKLMAEGVTIIDPASTFIDVDVTIGQDTIIEPFTRIKGPSKIGKGCRIGSHCMLDKVSIPDNATIDPHQYVTLEQVKV